MIVHGCSVFKNNTNNNCYHKAVKNKQPRNLSKMQTQQVNNTNFQALKGVKFERRFDPEKSAHAYELMKAFNLSFAINEIKNMYNIYAVFMTDWLTKNPNYPNKVYPKGEYVASVTTMLLAAKRLPPKDASTLKQLEVEAEPVMYYYIGMYGDTLSASEDNIAHFLRKVRTWDIKCGLTQEPKLKILEPLPKKYYDI